MVRHLLGFSVGSGGEGIDAVCVQLDGIGMTLRPRVVQSTRAAFPRELQLQLLAARRPGAVVSNTLPNDAAEFLIGTVRRFLASLGSTARAVTLVGLNLTSHAESQLWANAPERIAEQTGLTVWSGFAARDRIAGGMGRPWTPIADSLFAISPTTPRLLIHLGAAASILFIPASAKLTELVAFDAGPGNRFLDEIVRLGTHGKDHIDYRGSLAVQGRCLDELLAKWRAHSYFDRRPPKSLHHTEFTEVELEPAFALVRESGRTLPDLLCTATHLVARSIGDAVREHLPTVAETAATEIFVSGGGVRNGFIWQRLQLEFPEQPLKRTDDLGIPSLMRNATATAVIAGLSADGVCANLPLLTGASGARLVGRFTPGDPRNWGLLTRQMAEALWDYVDLPRAA